MIPSAIIRRLLLAADRTSVHVANIIVTRWPAVSLERNLIRASVRRSRKPEIREDERETAERWKREKKRGETCAPARMQVGTSSAVNLPVVVVRWRVVVVV